MGMNPTDQQKFAEAAKDEMAYYTASRNTEIARSVIAAELRRAKRQKLKGSHQAGSPQDSSHSNSSNGNVDDEIERYERKIVEYEQEIGSIRAKYSGRRRVDLHVSLAGLGAGIVAAREAAGLNQMDLAARLSVPIAHIEQWEQVCYADTNLADLCLVLTALGLNPELTLHLANDVPELGDKQLD